MADQLRHLAELARRATITVQVLPRAGAHTGLSGAFTAAQTADSLVVHMANIVDGAVTDTPATVSVVMTRFDVLRTEAYRGSESLEIIDKAAEEWAARLGGSPLTAVPTTTASR